MCYDSCRFTAKIYKKECFSDMHIERACPQDLPELLALQKLAYQSEAQLVGDFSIPPLTQTLDDLTRESEIATILKAVEGDMIVGSVRGTIREGTLHIGRLFVHPAHQNQGIGGKLLAAVEAAHPQMRCELFTSTLSVKNLSLYQKNGYREFARKPLNEKVLFVYLEKTPDCVASS